MREFVYFSQSARTSGNFNVNELMKAGRMDIAIHVLINTFFLSHDVRKDTRLHLIFYGQPTPPRHIEIQVTPDLDISKKDVGNLIKKILYKYREGKKTEAAPGCWIEKKSFFDVINGMEKEGKEIFILDKAGEDIRKAGIRDNCVFVLGDQDGLPKKELNRLKKIAKPVSVGNKVYFASHVVSIVNNELDRRAI